MPDHVRSAPTKATTTTGSMSFGHAFKSGDNALNFVRLCLALLVIVSHTAPIAGVDDLPGWFTGLGGWAVDGFFIISGYLIAGSRIRSSWWSYLVRRFARIFPGFWGATIITAFVFAPVAALLGGGIWTASSGTDFTVGNLGVFKVQYLMEGITFPFFQAWNGSSWTLRYELLAYLACFALLSVPFIRRHLVASATVMWCVTTVFWLTARPILDVTTNDFVRMGRLGSFFAIGMLTFALRDRLLAHWRYVLVAAGVVVALYCLGEAGEKFAHVPLAYLVLALGALLPVRLGSRNDISYGVYIYAFPIAQVMTFLGVQRFGGMAHMAAVAAVTVVFALGSWFFIERPSMAGAQSAIACIRHRRSHVESPADSNAPV